MSFPGRDETRKIELELNAFALHETHRYAAFPVAHYNIALLCVVCRYNKS